jgi:hypothetical protein
MKDKAKRKNLMPDDREAIVATVQRFYCDPQSGGIRAVADLVGAFDFSAAPPRQVREINPYAAQRIANAFKTYLEGQTTLDEAFGFRGTGRGSRSAGAKFRQAERQYRIVFDYLIAKEDGKSYEAAVALTAEQHNTSPETVKRLIKK